MRDLLFPGRGTRGSLGTDQRFSHGTAGGQRKKSAAVFQRMVVQSGVAPPKKEHQSLVTEVARGTSQIGDQLSGQGGMVSVAANHFCAFVNGFGDSGRRFPGESQSDRGG